MQANVHPVSSPSVPEDIGVFKGAAMQAAPLSRKLSKRVVRHGVEGSASLDRL